MIKNDRRDFLRLLGGATAGAAFPESISRALAIPAHRRTGTLLDVEHVVILMQENRSFDHYFGALRGVRGFGDPRPVNLPSGKPVWHQPHGNSEVLPFHPAASNLALTFIQDLAHDWTSTHLMWNNGNYDQWVPQKGVAAMAYLTRSDIPFHYALADAFTICDAYHCSLLGPTDSNRYHMWTGWAGNDGNGQGPVIDNAESGYGWSTYPERLEQAGISWKIYQDAGEGLDGPHFWGWTGNNPYIGNYGDNSLLYFHQYQNAQPGSPLYEKARRGTSILNGGTLFDIFRQDVSGGTLPQVSWIVAPEAYTEHPNWPTGYGEWYISQFLDILTAYPEVFSKTALFIMYDENDGFFDHVVPPTPPMSAAQGLSTVSTVNEIFTGSATYPVAEFPAGPYGLGVRVPMIVVSPWSKGGYVNSEVFDHTSLIRFLEKRFGYGKPGLIESNITPWRRAVSGDLTSAFNFERPEPAAVSLPGTAAYAAPAADIAAGTRHRDFDPVPPSNQTLPVQEPGLRRARPLPYELYVDGDADLANGAFRISFVNTGTAGAWFQVRSGNTSTGNTSTGPWGYTVEAGKSLSDVWNVAANPNGAYDLSVYGPNGFLRSYQGGVTAGRANLDVDSRYRDDGGVGIVVTIVNRGTASAKVTIANAYSGDTVTHTLPRGASSTKFWQLWTSFGWYDLVITVAGDAGFQQRLAGHVETGEDSVSDPAIGAV
jgi:phospholipase C